MYNFNINLTQSPLFDMQYDYFQKNCFDLLTLFGGWGCVQGQDMCVHGALCSIPFNSIYNMTPFSKKMWFDVLTSPQGSEVCERTEYVLTRCPMLHSH